VSMLFSNLKNQNNIYNQEENNWINNLCNLKFIFNF
jgi:hypothetical protein